jgi:hypothetical protein
MYASRQAHVQLGRKAARHRQTYRHTYLHACVYMHDMVVQGSVITTFEFTGEKTDQTVQKQPIANIAKNRKTWYFKLQITIV